MNSGLFDINCPFCSQVGFGSLCGELKNVLSCGELKKVLNRKKFPHPSAHCVPPAPKELQHRGRNSLFSTLLNVIVVRNILLVMCSACRELFSLWGSFLTWWIFLLVCRFYPTVLICSLPYCFYSFKAQFVLHMMFWAVSSFYMFWSPLQTGCFLTHYPLYSLF